MADVANKYPQNVAGRFYVDDQASIATFVVRRHLQILRDEETLCQEAMEGCPVEAIGSDANSWRSKLELLRITRFGLCSPIS